jgi:hypothetical protein
MKILGFGPVACTGSEFSVIARCHLSTAISVSV